MATGVIPGPGTIRVGRFIGRVGVVSLPAVGIGLDLDERVVRRHVAKLEKAGWLRRAQWTRGDGSVAWLTAAGIERVGLGGLRPVKAPPAPTTIAHGILVGWSAARIEHRQLEWLSSRELATDYHRWAVRMRCEHGRTQQLPDLAVWLDPAQAPVAMIAETGHRREDRQKWILDGWSQAVSRGQYAGVRYDCESASVVRWITRLPKKAWFAERKFYAAVQPTPDEIAALARSDAKPV